MSPATLACVPLPSGAERNATETCFAGRYRIDSVLGSGGMGVVYAATHLELGVPLALKILHPSLTGSPEARARFCIEARAGAALHSPHTLRIYDAGLLGSEECFIVMERLEGRNLLQLLRAEGPLPVDVAVNYVLQACTGLAEAHALGIVHRDIKPENLFLAQQGGGAPLIKLMDFGVARWRRTEVRGQRITNPHSNVGSPCYQAPEQMQSAASVDERCDIWALGLVLFELLAGYCPFESDSIPETCWKVLQGPRPSLSAARNIDPGLERVFQRCVALDPAQRFRSVSHLAAALRPFTKPVDNASGIRPLALTSLSVEPLPPRRRRNPSERLLWVAMFLLGAGIASALRMVNTRLPEGADAMRFASGLVSTALARTDGLVRKYLPAVANALPLVAPPSAPALAPALDPTLAVR
ncbi:MAG: serine/threonine-protein kinase [Deltaproteobacteria bacterium]